MPSSENRVYAVLDPESKSRIIDAIPPLYSELFLHHITLDFNGDLNKWRCLEGNKYSIIVNQVASNHEIQAVMANLSGIDIKSININPHITYSANEGVKPFKSNAMLESDDKQIITFEPIVITTQIKIELK